MHVAEHRRRGERQRNAALLQRHVEDLRQFAFQHRLVRAEIAIRRQPNYIILHGLDNVRLRPVRRNIRDNHPPRRSGQPLFEVEFDEKHRGDLSARHLRGGRNRGILRRQRRPNLLGLRLLEQVAKLWIFRRDCLPVFEILRGFFKIFHAQLRLACADHRRKKIRILRQGLLEKAVGHHVIVLPQKQIADFHRKFNVVGFQRMRFLKFHQRVLDVSGVFIRRSLFVMLRE